MRRLTPYLLLGTLVLAIGLGVGLGLSEAPVAQAVRPPATASAPRLGSCAVRILTPRRVGVQCTVPGSGISGSLTFGVSTALRGQVAHCLAKIHPAGLVPRGPGRLRRVLGVFPARALAVCLGLR